MKHAARWPIIGIGLVVVVVVVGLLLYDETTTRTETVFVYGTLTNPIIRTVMCRCLVGSTPATLPDYRQQGLTIIPDESHSTGGRLIAVSPRALAHLDRYEGVPTNYRRETVTIAGARVWVYIKNESQPSSI